MDYVNRDIKHVNLWKHVRASKSRNSRLNSRNIQGENRTGLTEMFRGCQNKSSYREKRLTVRGKM